MFSAMRSANAEIVKKGFISGADRMINPVAVTRGLGDKEFDMNDLSVFSIVSAIALCAWASGSPVQGTRVKALAIDSPEGFRG